MSTSKNYVRLTALLIIAWLAFSITASKLLVFDAGTPLPLGLAVVAPLALFAIWFAISPQFRQFALSLNPVALTIAQTWRIVGITFVVLASFGVLPNIFAQPAGWGDFAIGLTAPFVAYYLTRAGHKQSFIAWNLAGILDLVIAVALGVSASPALAGGLHPAVTTEAVTVLPLSLIPTFAVPLFLILHVIGIAQAARWETSTASRFPRSAVHVPLA